MVHRTNTEYVDMLLIYGEVHPNCTATSRIYTEQISNTHIPAPQK